MFARPFASRNGSTYPHVTTPFTTYFEPSGKSASARNMPRSSGGSGETTRSNESGRRLASRSCKIVTVRLTRLNFTNCQSVRPFPAERRSSSRFHAFMAKRSLPFDGRGRLGGDVVNNAVDAAHFVRNARGDAPQHIPRQGCEHAGHKVARFHTAHRDSIVIRASVAHDADALHAGEHRKILVGAAAALADLFADNGVRRAENGELFRA